MTTPDIAVRFLDGAAIAAQVADLQALHAEVYAHMRRQRPDNADSFAERFRVQRRQPGFALAAAQRGDYLIGYAAGMPLRPSTSWWRDLTTPLASDVTAEYPGRTFALVELLVRPSWRRQGIGRALHELILANRSEERATLMVPPTALAAQSAFHSWGWRKVARTRAADPGSPALDVLVVALPVSYQPA